MSEAGPSSDVRWKQRFHNFRKAFAQLRAAVETSRLRELSDLEKQGLIQAFEFSHELAWNTLKDYLEYQGETEIHGSRNATRKAFQRGVIEDGETWMAMIESRNLSTHTYNAELAREIVTAVTGAYLAAFQKFEQRLGELEKNRM